MRSTRQVNRTADKAIDEEGTQSELIHERLQESPFKRWLLLDGNRYVLAALLSLVVFVVCAAVGFAGFIPVEDPATATTLVAAIVGGTLPFITIVLAINQLVLVVRTVVTLVFLPFIVLLVYRFRIASIASRTAEFGPFVPRVDFED